MVFIRLEQDAVAGPDYLDRTAFALAEADALGDPDRLPVRVRMPGVARAGVKWTTASWMPEGPGRSAIVSM
jgi:hypothetical protein